MKVTRLILILLLLTGLILVTAQSEVWARASDSPMGGSLIETDGRSKGTKLSGPLTINYDIAPDGSAAITFFMRLRQGHTLRIFGGTEYVSDYNNIADLQAAIEAFVDATVIPALFGLVVPDWKLKSVDQIIEPDDPTATPGCCGGMAFTIMDVVIAVED